MTTYDHRQAHTAKKADRPVINFHLKDNTSPYRCFRNLHKEPFFIDGLWYPTMVHWYQSQKTTDETRREKIRTAPSAGKASLLGRDRSATKMRPNWKRNETMYRGCMAKFSQHPDLWAVLDGTGDAILVATRGYSRYWGRCDNQQNGQNQLGKILMRVREELRAAYAMMALS